MPGTCRWIMNGMTLMPAPTIEQTPVAVRPSRPISRARPARAGAAGTGASTAVGICRTRTVYRKRSLHPRAAPPVEAAPVAQRLDGGDGRAPEVGDRVVDARWHHRV